MLTLLLACATAADTYLGREIAPTMGYQGAPWLVRAEREVEEAPTLLHAELALEPGQTACDLGSGNGYHSVPMARAVGRRGRVIASDIQPEMLAMLQRRAAEAGIRNIDTVRATATDPGFPKGGCDLVLLVDVYHELSDPEAVLAKVRESLSPTGRIALVEYRAEDPGVPMKPLHKMTAAQCDRELAANGFEKTGQFDGLPWQHLLFYSPRRGPGATTRER